jgi:uncharacterized protein (DUF1697 family)
MQTYIALLRGINVSGKNIVAMSDLKAYVESFGAKQVRTYIQSGNVVFKHEAKTAGEVRVRLEQHLEKRLGSTIPTVVKLRDGLKAAAEGNPYDSGTPDFGKQTYLCFFERVPSTAAIESIQPWITGTERLEVKGDIGYAHYSISFGRAKLSHAVIERKLGTTTMRNWNTVTRLLEMAYEEP